MDRLLKFTTEHEIFRRSFGAFLDKEAVPYYKDWEKAGSVPRELYKKFGAQGYLGISLPVEYGGAEGDLLYTIIQTEEMNKRGLNCIFTRLHSDVVAPYIAYYGTEEQKKRWLPDCVSGEKILALALSEPNAGSDLASLSTKAEKDGDNYILTGSKAFISNGMLADLIVVAARTDFEAKPHKGISLFVVETKDLEGFSRAQLEKVGYHAQDTSQIFFKNCKIPKENLLGEENKGFTYVMVKLQQERLIAAINALGFARYSLDLTVDYVKNRRMFGQTLGQFQNTQFSLAKMAVEIESLQSFIDHLTLEHMAGKKLGKETSMAKYAASELASNVSSRCVQFFGGYGLCSEFAISRQFMDSRFLPILAGSSEVQLLIVARELGL